MLHATDPQPTEAAQARERVLVASRSGAWFCVAEVSTTVDTGELEDFLAYEVSGYFRTKARAGIRRARLAREGRWLSAESVELMRQGQVLRVNELQWERDR